MARRSGRSNVRNGLAGLSTKDLRAYLEQLHKLRSQQDPDDLEPIEILEDWQTATAALLDSHRPNHQRVGQKLKGSIELKTVDPAGSCELVLRCGASTYRSRVEFDFDERTFAASCNCGHIDLCEHTYFVASKLEAMLEDPRSDIAKKIVGEDDSDRELKKTFSLLQSLARNAQQDQILLSSKVSAAETVQQRFVWDFTTETHFGSVHLRPCLQQEKKNGGWTKGKESSLESFMSASRDNWSQIDYQLAALIRQERWSAMTIDAAEALKILVGTDQFTVEREPFLLEIRPLELLVEETENGFELATNVERYCREEVAIRQMVDVGRGVVLVIPEQKTAVYFCGPRLSYEICERLVNSASTIPVEQKDLLLKEIEPLRQSMSVRLPEKIGGKAETYSAEAILLLQLRRNGMLDATLQMRDQNQLLHLPGEGVTTISQTVDGESIQYVRDLGDEIRRAGDLASAMKLKRGVPLHRWGWRIADGEEISDLLTDAGAFVERGEVTVLWHKDSVSRFDVIGRLSANNVRVEVTRQRDWFGLTGTCKIGEHEIPLKELLAGMHGRPANGLLEISPGKWATVAEELRAALRRLSDVSLESRGKLQLDASAAPVMNVLEAAKIQIEADKHWDKCLTRLREATELPSDPPAGLNCDLRDYQLEGFRWLNRLSHWGIGGILADDMGLGKTVQTLALLLTRVESGPALVIAPTSLGFNWERECERFTPSLRPILFRESDRVDLKNTVSDGDLVICSYGLALREAELLKEIQWGTLVLDEAQNIKNSNSKTASHIRTFSAGWKIALTGTPMENHLGELWSIFHTVAPGVLGSWEQFRKRFASPIEKDGNSDRRQALSQVIAPFILRRSKAEVLKDLPSRSESNLLVDLSAEERTRYDQMRLAAVSELDQIGEENLSHDQRFKVLQMLTRLRQLSCHIGLVDEKWKGSSSKLDVLMEQLEQLKERGHRPLIFSQFTTHLALIRESLDKAGITYQYLDGQTTPTQRQTRVEAFQNGESDAFLISLKAGGTGLNLTGADYVIHMDPWWNPAVEDQATDRAHRIGQTRPVMVYRIIARGTIEEQILKLHDEKRDLVDGVLSGSDAAGRLSTQELAELIRQGVEVPLRKSK